MLDTASQAALQSVYRRESRTFLQYVRESSPWVAVPHRDLFQRFLKLAELEADAVGEIGRFLDDHRITLPYLGTYPTRFTAYNFADVRKLLPVVIDDHRRHLTELEKERESLAAEARPPIDHLIRLRRDHLIELERLQGLP